MALIEAVNVSHSYGGVAASLVDVSLKLGAGEVAYITGRSGCGKSTLLKLLNRLLEPSAGSLSFKGEPYRTHDVRALRKKIQLVPQVPVLFDMSVRENLLLAAPGADDAKITELLDDLNLPGDMLDKNAKKLSVGQMQRVCVARSLLLEPEAILLDEPTAPLDPDNAEIFQSLVERIRQKSGMAAVWVTHDPARAKTGSRRLVMENGRLHDH